MASSCSKAREKEMTPEEEVRRLEDELRFRREHGMHDWQVLLGKSKQIISGLARNYLDKAY